METTTLPISTLIDACNIEEAAPLVSRVSTKKGTYVGITVALTSCSDIAARFCPYWNAEIGFGV